MLRKCLKYNFFSSSDTCNSNCDNGQFELSILNYVNEQFKLPDKKQHYIENGNSNPVNGQVT